MSIRQPWVELIVSGEKSLEIRTWHTAYRGPLAIVASAKPVIYVCRDCAEWSGRASAATRRGKARLCPECGAEVAPLPTGACVAVADLVDCRQVRDGDEGPACCDLDGTEIAWVLRNVRPLAEPFPVKGRLGLYEVEVPE